MDKSTSGDVRTCSVAETVITNVDLLTEILLRLPPKSLLRFTSVSKIWFLLITDPRFSSTHTRGYQTSVSYAVYSLVGGKPLSLEVPGYPSHPPNFAFAQDILTRRIFTAYIMHSCNGLLLCNIVSNWKCHYFVWNPTTRNKRMLSEFRWLDHKLPTKSSFFNSCLAFDPTKSLHYKVVMASFRPDHPTDSCEINVYRSESASWDQRLMFHVPGMWGLIYQKADFWNGAIHWISEGGYHIWFDLNINEFKGIKLPAYPRILPREMIRYFGACDDRLFLIQTVKWFPLEFSVLEMGRDYCSWIGKYHVNLSDFVSHNPGLDMSSRASRFQVLTIVKANTKDLSLVLSVARKVISYDLPSKKWNMYHDCPDSFSKPHYGCRAYPFIESLTPV